jgi:hypothetical protein
MPYSILLLCLFLGWLILEDLGLITGWPLVIIIVEIRRRVVK